MPSISWREARRIASAAAAPLSSSDVPLAQAVGRVLAAAVQARADLPGFDTAAMDGYAVAGAGPWDVVGRVLAGGPEFPGLLPGQAVEIMTGAVVPVGAVAVLPYETADLRGTVVGNRAHIRRAGEDARAGDALVPAGRLVTPAVAGLLAQAGVDEVPVWRRPLVRLVVTGDEVVGAGVPLRGQVRDVFGPMVTALVSAAGGTVVPAEHVLLRDDPGALGERLLAPGVDVVVVTGSSSAGAADHLHGVLERVGARLLVDGVACRPGGPQLLASLPGAADIGSPGTVQAGSPGTAENGSRGAAEVSLPDTAVASSPGTAESGLPDTAVASSPGTAESGLPGGWVGALPGLTGVASAGLSAGGGQDAAAAVDAGAGGRGRARWVVGLPGNPFAGLVAAVTVLQPLLRGLTGRTSPPSLRLPVRGDVVVTAPVTRLVPVRLAGDHAVVVPGSRPASLAGAAAADALAVLEDGWTDGSPADLLPLD